MYNDISPKNQVNEGSLAIANKLAIAKTSNKTARVTIAAR
jgi:hypothetical protein